MKKILLVDDDPEIVTLLTAKLSAAGPDKYIVLSAADGREALRLAEKEKPDLMVCDIDMPELDGPDLAQTLGQREATKNVSVIFLSSLVTPKDAARNTETGHFPMLSKQTPIQELVRNIERYL